MLGFNQRIQIKGDIGKRSCGLVYQRKHYWFVERVRSCHKYAVH